MYIKSIYTYTSIYLLVPASPLREADLKEGVHFNQRSLNSQVAFSLFCKNKDRESLFFYLKNSITEEKRWFRVFWSLHLGMIGTRWQPSKNVFFLEGRRHLPTHYNVI